jgi:hypothetical protein
MKTNLTIQLSGPLADTVREGKAKHARKALLAYHLLTNTDLSADEVRDVVERTKGDMGNIDYVLQAP